MDIESLVSRVSEVVNTRFKCQVKVVDQLTTPYIEAIDPEVLDTVRRNVTAKMLMVHGDLVIPFEDRSELIAFAIISGGAELPWTDMEQVSDTVELLLKSSLIENHRQRELDSFENFLATQTGQRNVVSLTDHPKFEEKQQFIDLEMMTISPKMEGHYLVEAANPEELRRHAVDIHEELGRQIMVSLSDIAPDLLLSAKDLYELGEMTLLIPNLESTPLATQVLCEQYLRTARPLKDSPLLILGTTGNVEEFVDQKRVLKDFLEIPNVMRVRAPSVQRMSRQEVIEAIATRTDLQRRKHLTVVPKI